MSSEILDQQLAFATAYVAGGGNATKAAVNAGYSPVSARQTASRLLRLPHVQEAIRRAQTQLLRGRLASKAIGVLEKILDNDEAPAGVRVDAAKAVLDRAGFAAARVPEPDDGAHALAQLSVAQLDEFIRSGQARLDDMSGKANAVLDQSAVAD